MSNRHETKGASAAGFDADDWSECGDGAGGQHGTGRKPTVIMIEGAWHWAGCFQKVANLLALRGYPVLLPDLKSHGYSDATYDQVSCMADYVAPVAALLEKAQEPVVLLGHSMGGATLTSLGELYPHKIRRLIYLAAYMTPNGKTVNDYVSSPAYATDPSAAELFQVLSPSADGKGLTLDTTKPALIKAAFYGDCSEHDVALAAANVIPTTSNVPGNFVPTGTASRYGSLPRTYIECTADRAIPITQQRQMQADVPGATVMTLDASHSPFFSQPERLAEMVAAALEAS
ncbi:MULTISPECIES: alpha/beta fold hydrolase [unclassified Variovorax]|uniref:alpha/beta fold hydrolase n=1 Tax=unclassified Variovorax TaxID=663243 RepID=UPI0008CDA10C|nr:MULTISPECIES: alpha/beta fold hydrolase [unclassified Variovorax]SEK17344.1 Pimeloyl-ACP methyl ester carboxylesterase [Variovorax sp. OK202]SFE80375.1 Pimeloyl-ACP methyl ester carboxylesterase [Variovorax sp. OK212]